MCNRVAVYTSDLRGAGTDANVSVEIHGDKGFVGSTRLENKQVGGTEKTRSMRRLRLRCYAEADCAVRWPCHLMSVCNMRVENKHVGVTVETHMRLSMRRLCLCSVLAKA